MLTDFLPALDLESYICYQLLKLRLPEPGHGGRLRVCWASGFNEGGKRASEGEGGKGLSSSMAGSGSVKVPGVTLGANMTALGEILGEELIP